jgi:branched-chain amino acid transport system ATP-binding protein
VADMGVVMENGRVARVDAASDLLADEEVSRHYLGTVSPASTGSSIPSLPEQLRQRIL